jgi:SMI1 / KNR4 family (SUKH-1)
VTADSQTFQPNSPASEQILASLVAGVSAPLPDDYMAFLRRANGGEGFIGDRYVQLWKAEELVEMNRAYQTAELFPNLFFIGSDGGGEAYAFALSRTDATVFEVPFVGLPTDASAIANSFDSFLATRESGQ